MEVAIRNGAGEAVGSLTLSAALERPFNEDLVHQVVVAYMAGGRAGTKAQKNRSAVSGGGRKPWRQKGTGRARAGSIRSPLWRSGGKTFAAVPRDHSQKVNRKAYRAAIAGIFAELLRQERLVVLDDISIAEPKTRQMVGWLKQFGSGRTLLVSEQIDENLYLASRNLADIAVTDVAGLDPVSLVGAERVLITAAAMQRVEEWLA
jgi:large subunit ribosomal protein L4